MSAINAVLIDQTEQALKTLGITYSDRAWEWATAAIMAGYTFPTPAERAATLERRARRRDILLAAVIVAIVVASTFVY